MAFFLLISGANYMPPVQHRRTDTPNIAARCTTSDPMRNGYDHLSHVLTGSTFSLSGREHPCRFCHPALVTNGDYGAASVPDVPANDRGFQDN
jgi:hypothetical protein